MKNRIISKNLNIIYSIFKNNKVVFIISVFSFFLWSVIFNYHDGLTYTTWSVNIWDSIFSGRIREFFVVTAESLRNPPHKFGTSQFLESFIWSIWNFPLWLTHSEPTSSVINPFCMFYSKMFLFLWNFAIGLVCYDIVNFFTKSIEKSSWAFIFVLGSITMMNSIGYAAQNEVFYLFFYLFSIDMVLKERKIAAYIALLICVDLNPYMILFALFPIASMEKKLFHILLKSLSCFFPILLERLFFKSVGGSNNIRNFINEFFFKNPFPVAWHSISFFIFIFFVLIAIYIFYGKYFQSQKNLPIFSALLMCAACIFSWQNHYRLANYLPFLIICILIVENDDLICINLFVLWLLDISLFLTGCTNTSFLAKWLSPFLIRKMHIVQEYPRASFWQMLQTFVPKEIRLEIILVTFSAAAFVVIFYSFRTKRSECFNRPLSVKKIAFAHCVTPLCILALFISLTYINYCVRLIPIISDNINWNGKSSISYINTSEVYEKEFAVFKDMKLKYLKFCTITWKNHYDDTSLLSIEFSDDRNNILFSKNIQCNSFKDAQIYTVELQNDNINLSKEKKYTLRIKSNLYTPPRLALKQSPDGTVAIQLYGEK